VIQGLTDPQGRTDVVWSVEPAGVHVTVDPASLTPEDDYHRNEAPAGTEGWE
jgi:hypothetical protein